MNYKSTEQKKDEYIQYLKDTGVFESLANTVVELFYEPEKPPNAIGFVKQSQNAYMNPEIEQLAEECQVMRDENENLMKTIILLKQKLGQSQYR